MSVEMMREDKENKVMLWREPAGGQEKARKGRGHAAGELGWGGGGTTELLGRWVGPPTSESPWEPLS